MSHHRYLWALRKNGTIARLGRVLAAQAKIKAAALARSLGASVMISKALPNPRQPAPGESWVGPGGEKVKVTSVGAGRVVVLGASGSRRSIDPLEFRAVWRPATARLNARRNLSGGRRSSRARRTGGGSVSVSGRKRRTCNPKGPVTTIREAVARVLIEAKFPQLVKEVRSGKADPLMALELARKFMRNETQRALIDRAIRLVRRSPNPKGRNVTARRNPEQVHGGPGRGPGRAPARSIAIAIGRTTATATATASPTVHSPTSTSTSTRAKTSTDTDTSTATDTRSPSNTTTNRRRKNARAAFKVGERVSVPYTGRSSYFGRRVKRTNEKATVQGVNADGSVLVTVKRGKSVEQHTFPPSSVRRLPKRGGQRAGTKARLQVKGARERRKAELAAASRATTEYQCLEAKAKLMDPAAREYRAAISRLGRLRNEIEAHAAIAHDLQVADPAYQAAPDPFATATNRRRKKVRPGRNRKGRFVRGNPRTERARALRTRARWHDNDETTVRYATIKGPPRRIPKTLVRLGSIHSITYESDKYAGSRDNPTGRQILYEHETKRPRPVLATDPDGRHFHIVGGKMRMTADGLVN